MDIATLCNEIELQSEIKSRVLAFADRFDFETVDRQLKGFLSYENRETALKELQEILGEDKDNDKILACTLKASADAFDFYREKGISDEIYFDTMKCYTRFIDETCRMTGKLYFDRYWWTIRQAGCHLFRIGALEYEIKYVGETMQISLHIPSDADFSPASVDESLERAEKLFGGRYPAVKNLEYRCHSWLLDRQLRGMLSEKSNIIRFQNRFEILDEGEADREFVQWVYNCNAVDDANLPENTSLQKKIKNHILSGGVIRNAYGRIK